MLKVLIVDDERGICDLIFQLIDWNSLYLKCVGFAHTGQDAYSSIQNDVPDIVITDIRMPGLDGLELIRRCYYENRDIDFIVISGYRDFEYAQKALKYRAEDYLLKPVDQDELNQLLSQLQKKIWKEHARNEHETAQQEQLQNQLEVLRRNRLREMLRHTEARLDQPLFADAAGAVCAMVIKLDFLSQDVMNQKTAATILENIAMHMREALRLRGYFCEDALETWDIVLAVQSSDDLWLDKKQVLECCGMILKDAQRKYCNVRLTLFRGTAFTTWADFPKAIASAKALIEYRIANVNQTIWDGACLNPEPETSDTRLLSLLERAEEWPLELPVAAESGKVSLEEAFEQLAPKQWYLFTKRLLELQFQRAYVQNLISAEQVQKELRPLTDWLCHCVTKGQFLQCIQDFAKTLHANKRIREREPILAAKKYVEEHIDKQITLNEIAEVLHFSPVYYSSYFKEKTGVSFVDYVIKVRIEKAMEYLRDTELSVYEVAEKVGYADAKHFSKVFKKVVKIKPTEYRQFYS